MTISRTHIHIHTHIHTSTRTHTHTYTHTLTHVHTYTHTHTRTHIHSHTYTHASTHTHTYTPTPTHLHSTAAGNRTQWEHPDLSTFHSTLQARHSLTSYPSPAYAIALKLRALQQRTKRTFVVEWYSLLRVS